MTKLYFILCLLLISQIFATMHKKHLKRQDHSKDIDKSKDKEKDTDKEEESNRMMKQFKGDDSNDDKEDEEDSDKPGKQDQSEENDDNDDEMENGEDSNDTDSEDSDDDKEIRNKHDRKHRRDNKDECNCDKRHRDNKPSRRDREDKDDKHRRKSKNNKCVCEKRSHKKDRDNKHEERPQKQRHEQEDRSRNRHHEGRNNGKQYQVPSKNDTRNDTESGDTPTQEDETEDDSTPEQNDSTPTQNDDDKWGKQQEQVPAVRNCTTPAPTTPYEHKKICPVAPCKNKRNCFKFPRCNFYQVNQDLTHYGCSNCGRNYEVSYDLNGAGYCIRKNMIDNCVWASRQADINGGKQFCQACEKNYILSEDTTQCRKLKSCDRKIDNCKSYGTEDDLIVCNVCKDGYTLSEDGKTCTEGCCIKNCSTCAMVDKKTYCSVCEKDTIGVYDRDADKFSECLGCKEWQRRLLTTNIYAQ